MSQQPKSKKATTMSPRMQRVIKLAEDLKDDSKVNAQHIVYQSFGSDKNKTRKNSKACDRGTSSGPARYCSSHIRQIYPQDIIGDNNKTEWCVGGRHNEECCKNNPCRLCNINTNNYIKTPMINFAKAICAELGVNCNNNDQERYNRALQSFLTSHIISDYPGTNKENTILRIKVNDKVWMQYFIKLTAFSSLLKTSAPSGYKYKDRISIGRKIKIQNNKNRDLIFCIEKDASYNDPEKEEQRPVVNCVGFWNLLKKAKPDEIRNIIHLNIDQGVNVCFGFLIKNNNNINMRKIEVELECTRHGLGLKEKPITLWCWPSNIDDNNSMSSIDAHEQKSNASGSPTISTQSLTAPSISPMAQHVDYPSFDASNLPIIPTIPHNSIPMQTLPPQIPQIPQMAQLQTPQRMNNIQYQPQIEYVYTNHYQQPQPIMNDNDNMSYYSSSYDTINNNNHHAVASTSHPITNYGGYHTANYRDNRYSPYPIPRQQQRQMAAPITIPNNSIAQMMDLAIPIEYNNNNDEYETMQQDQFVQDVDQPSFAQNNIDVLNIDNFPLLPDNPTSLFIMNGLDDQSMM